MGSLGILESPQMEDSEASPAAPREGAGSGEVGWARLRDKEVECGDRLGHRRHSLDSNSVWKSPGENKAKQKEWIF